MHPTIWGLQAQGFLIRFLHYLLFYVNVSDPDHKTRSLKKGSGMTLWVESQKKKTLHCVFGFTL